MILSRSLDQIISAGKPRASGDDPEEGGPGQGHGG